MAAPKFLTFWRRSPDAASEKSELGYAGPDVVVQLDTEELRKMSRCSPRRGGSAMPGSPPGS